MKTLNAPVITSIFFLILMLIPIASLIQGVLLIGGGVSLGDFIEVLTSPITTNALATTLLYGLGAATLSVSIGIVFTWLVTRTNVPGAKVFRNMMILPLAMPFLVKAFAWIFLLSPRIGIINTIFMNFLNLKQPIFDVFSLPGMILASGLGGLPLVFLTMEPVFKSMDSSLEEASLVTGNGTIKTFAKVTLPVVLPAVFSSFLLMMIMASQGFDYPYMLGNPVGIRTLAIEIYWNVSQRVPPRYTYSAILSIITLILSFALLSIYIWITRHAFKFVVVTGKPTRQRLLNLRRWRYIGFVICLGTIFASFILPFSVLLLMSFSSYYSPDLRNLNFTLNNYVRVFNLPFFERSVINSVFLGISAGLAATFLATILAYVALRSKVKATRITEYASGTPLAFPGVVYGLAIYWTFLMVPGLRTIFGTIWPLVMALSILRLPHCYRIVSGAIIQIHRELEEASRVSGSSWIGTIKNVTFPLISRGMINSFKYTFINSIRELGAVVLLISSQSIVLMVILLNLYSQHAAALGTVAAGSMVIVAIIMGSLVVISTIERMPYLTTKVKKAFSKIRSGRGG